MILINADEVKKYIHDLMLNNADKYTDKEMAQYDDLIDSCQPVEAIPVEWIRKYTNKIGASNGIMNMHREHLKTLIKDWEKENGK